MDFFGNYRKLLAKVDGLCRTIVDVYRPLLACREGCSDCCRAIGLFPVEAAFLASALSRLPEVVLAPVQKEAEKTAAAGRCPLLVEDRCLIYEARPIICRTHGLPLLIGREGAAGVDFCPKNFQGMESLPAQAIIDLERLNLMLAAVNQVFVEQTFSGPPPERIAVLTLLTAPSSFLPSGP